MEFNIKMRADAHIFYYCINKLLILKNILLTLLKSLI